jgi:uncharacterized protein DUF742
VSEAITEIMLVVGAVREEAAAPAPPGPTPRVPAPDANDGASATGDRAASAVPGSVDAVPESDAGSEPLDGGSAFVRPYVFTGGRTRSAFVLSMETLVSAAPHAASAGLTGEQEMMLSLSREPVSVAELSARAGVPLGVARVLVGDLAAAGAVAVHRSVGDGGPDLALMQRVLSGLRRL